MKRINLVLFCFISMSIIILSCRKEIFNESFNENAFFENSNNDKLVSWAATNLKQQNSNINFASEIFNKFGNPEWKSSLSFNDNEGKPTIITPFINNDDKQVIAIWIIYYENGQLKTQIMSRDDIKKVKLHKTDAKADANDYAIMFGYLENNIFNTGVKILPKIEKLSSINPLRDVTTSSYVTVEVCTSYYQYAMVNGEYIPGSNQYIGTRCYTQTIWVPDAPPATPTYPTYPPPNYGGGTSTSSEKPEYICNCDCSENDGEMIDASLSYEPKWGQLGNLNSIKIEINKRINQVSNFNNLSLKDRLFVLKDYFNANRNYKRDTNGELVDATDSKLIDRYIYTESNGWIDMHHFFYAAFLSEANSAAYAFTFTTAAEYIQSQLSAQQNSAFSYEDLPSNLTGIKFWQQYGQGLKNGTINFDVAITNYFNQLRPKEPSEAPNYPYIPHIIDNFVPKNNTSKGLIGDALKNAAKESFCKKSTKVKENIKEAHIKINHSVR